MSLTLPGPPHSLGNQSIFRERGESSGSEREECTVCTKARELSITSTYNSTSSPRYHIFRFLHTICHWSSDEDVQAGLTRPYGSQNELESSWLARVPSHENLLFPNFACFYYLPVTLFHENNMTQLSKLLFEEHKLMLVHTSATIKHLRCRISFPCFFS